MLQGTGAEKSTTRFLSNEPCNRQRREHQIKRVWLGNRRRRGPSAKKRLPPGSPGGAGSDEPPPGTIGMMDGIKIDPPGGVGVRITCVEAKMGGSPGEGKAGGMIGVLNTSELGS